MIGRRAVVAALVAFVASPVLAQNTNLQAGNSSSSPAPEHTHHQATLAVGSLSLLASRLAVTRARGAQVKQFAEFEVAEQETIADVLLTLDGKQQVEGKLRQPSDAEATQNLDAAGRDAFEKLRSVQAGPAFDQAYLKLEMDGHEQLLQAQNNYLAVGTDLGRVNLAKMAKGQIREHIQLLANLDRDATVTGSIAPRTTGQAPAALRK